MDDKQDRETLFEKHRENIYFRWGLTAFVVVVACIVVAQFVTKLTMFFAIVGALVETLSPVFYGLGIAYLLDPIVGRVELRLRPWLSRHMRQAEKVETAGRGAGVLVALAILVLVVWALLSMILPQLRDSIETIVGNLPAYYNTLRQWVTDLIDDNLEIADITGELMESVYNYINNWLTTTMMPKIESLVNGLTVSIFSLAKVLMNLVLGVIISVYLLLGKRKFLSRTKKLCYGFLGEKRGGYVLNVCTFANQAFGGFIGGKIVDSIIIGLLCFIGMQAMTLVGLLDMPYAMLISIIVGITNIIPFFGPYLGAIPSALLLLVIDPMQSVYFIIFIVILQQVDGNIIGPMILGDATGLDGFWVVVSILVFGSFYGLMGMVVAVPLFAVIYKIITEITNRLLSNQGLSTVTADYEAWNYPPRPGYGKWRGSNRRARRTRTKKTDKAPPADSPKDAAKDSPEDPPADSPSDSPK